MKDLIESLNEAHELDNPRKLHEGSPITIDKEAVKKDTKNTKIERLKGYKGTDLYEALNRAHKLDESSSEWFTKMKNWLKETRAEEEEFFWSDYHDYVDEIYGEAIEKVTEGYAHINVGFEFSTQAGRGMCQVFGSDDDGSGEYTWDFEEDREAVFEFVNESASVEQLFSSLVDYLSGKVDCIQWEDSYDDYDDEEDFDEALNSAHELDEDVGDEFYRDAEKELENHFKCSGAVLEPSIQAGRGSTFLYADDMKFNGSFDFETGEEYINNDDFVGFLRLCLDSFEPVVDNASADKHTKIRVLDPDTIEKRRADARKFWYGEDLNREHCYEDWDDVFCAIEDIIESCTIFGRHPYWFDAYIRPDRLILDIGVDDDDTGRTGSHYEATLSNVDEVPTITSELIRYVENLPWKATGETDVDDE